MKRSETNPQKRNLIGEDDGGGKRKSSVLSVDLSAQLMTPQVIKEKRAVSGQGSQESRSRNELQPQDAKLKDLKHSKLNAARRKESGNTGNSGNLLLVPPSRNESSQIPREFQDSKENTIMSKLSRFSKRSRVSASAPLLGQKDPSPKGSQEESKKEAS